MKTATPFQFWSVPRLARTVLVIVAGLLLFVVSASMIERQAPEMTSPKSSQGSERKAAPGLPDRHHRIDVLA